MEMQPAPEMELVTSTLATEYIASATGVTDIVATDSSLRKRKSSGSLQSPRVRPGTRTQVHDDEIRHEVFHVNIASADEMEEAASVHELASKRTPSELDDVKSGVEHVKKDLKEARKMLEFLVRRERKVDTQAEAATRRLERLEREKEDEEDREHETNLEEALTDKTKVVNLVVDKWFVDRGFGFGKVPTGEIVFIHANAVVGAEVLTIGTDAWVQVVNDDARAQGGYRARRAWGQDVWKAEKDKEKANKVAQQVRRAAALTAELAAQSEKKTAAVCDQPPGLDELAGHIEAPNMGAGGSHPQATMMPDPWATYKCPSASQAIVTSPLPASQGFSNFSGKSRKGQPRSDTRTQQVKERDRWSKQEEEKQRLQDKREEAWQLFQRQPSWGPKRREDFEREYKQKVSAGPLYSPFGSDKREEKSLQEWVDKLLVNALAEDRRKEARECQRMEQEDSNSQNRRRWEKIWGPRSPVPSPFRITSDSFDVRTATLTSSMTGTASPQTTTH